MLTVYKVLLSRTAEKQLKRLPKEIQIKIAAAILSLELDPRPAGSKKLAGAELTYRIRVGNYRVIYDIEDKIVTVVVLKIAHRKDVYR